MSGSCISLAGSTTCPAFNASYISTDSTLVSQFPFLAYVGNVQEFDQQLSNWVKGPYVKEKYQELLGCTNVNLTNTSDYYARYTTSVICNGIVQNSKGPCGLSNAQSMPLCADTCALAATSEEEIAVNSKLCGTPQPNFMSQIRADFTNCALPADSLSGSCISGEQNEPDECGYGTNLLGLCSYCAASSPNATDSCCINSNAAGRCTNVHLPSPTTLPPLFPSSTSTSLPSATSNSTNSSHGLSGGQIAGIAIGSVAGFALLVGLLALLLICLRRRQAQGNNILNQPTPHRKGVPQMQYAPAVASQKSYEPVPGGRVARMSALQAESEGSPRTHTGTARVGGAKYSDTDSERLGASPGAFSRRGPPVTSRRHGSLSSTSVLAMEGENSPRSGTGGQVSSPEGVASGQSEQLPYFRDYYSQDDIHPGDAVSVLWAYQPRAADEFELERGDMLKVVGIWDDGWATGVRLSDRAEDFDAKHNPHRDSGVSNGSERQDSSPPPRGEIKAFPLVCVCLPQHWRKIIEGDVAAEAGSPPA
ncbi:hypothetical protein VTN77DRAFT_9053 [Rasamsonia byssochlamydoides]|uniref:uncharacterized protein n=1 Tax=Rasamsonia byssochlamydoides TaxID=89139 RepID=UPI003742405A